MTSTITPTSKRTIRPRLLDFMQRLVLFIVSLTAFAAGVVALLSYFGILPPAFHPLVDWMARHVFHP